MPKYTFFFICAFFLLTSQLYSQKKTLQTEFTKEKITIDGKFDEAIWQTASVASDFVMIYPDNGKPVEKEKRSETRITYDNNAIYVAATLYDNEPNKILSELTLRDSYATAEHFGVFLNGFNDGQQEFRFYVSAAGVQMDCIYTEERGEDFLWNAIWESEVKITDFGWVVEMRIPYAALRFSSQQKQKWGINFYREIRHARQMYTWSLIDNKIINESVQAGELEGIENIKTPTRLFFIPYSSLYLHSSKAEKTYGEFKGGLDIKYGINDAFTLDAILIPDFGQTKYDNIELNLSPFKQQFIENRSFFTEGIDMFSKGDLLYTRRIGEIPEIEINDNESIVDYPNSIKIVNALKVSGRTKRGLGIGVMNAITEEKTITIKDNDTNETRIETIAPVTNYNVFVLDQRFNKNSSVSLVNTNATRNGEFRDANVSALVWDLNTSKNTYNLKGDFKYSFLNNTGDLENRDGINTYIDFGDTNGKYRYDFGAKYVSDDYDNNDLGLIYQTHFYQFYSNASYRILKSTKKFYTFQSDLNLSATFENKTGKAQASVANAAVHFTDNKIDYYYFGIISSPLKTYDFYEPRSVNEDKFLAIPENIGLYISSQSNGNRKFSLYTNPVLTFYNEKGRNSLDITLAPKYRFNDRLSLVYTFYYQRLNNNVGWVDFDDEGNTILTRRNRNTYTNSLEGKYSVNNKINFNLSIRHYLSYSINMQYLTLQDDGSVINNDDYTTNKNSNLNTWNMDLSYSWWFAPGSQILVLYRNNSLLYSRDYSYAYGNNFKDAISRDNLKYVFSISIRYFIDYNRIKN